MESEKLVSADGLREWLKNIPLHDLSDGRGLCRIIFAEDFERAMASFPGEAIQIVRCKDCKHSTLPSALTQRYGVPGTLTCHNRYSPCNRRNVGGEDFCSYGERREE